MSIIQAIKSLKETFFPNDEYIDDSEYRESVNTFLTSQIIKEIDV